MLTVVKLRLLAQRMRVKRHDWYRLIEIVIGSCEVQVAILTKIS
jgi:hypothetical protein